MKLIKKHQAKPHKNSLYCDVLEYDFSDKDINGALIHINGRYPEEGRAVNLKCKELVYIIEGSGKLFVDNKGIELMTGDSLLIEAQEKYYFEGKLVMYVPSVPAWNFEQYKIII